MRQAGRLSLSGAQVASNGGPGVFLQERAVADTIAFVDVLDNAALGLGVYGTSRIDGSTARNAIQGLSPTAPATAVTVRDSLASGG